MKKFDFRKT